MSSSKQRPPSEKSRDEAPESAAPPLAAPASAAAPAEPSRSSGFRRHLPRAGLILFVVVILVTFREVLLPFVLGIFFAYLIYPIVSRLERIPVGQRHPPRWLAVITVYALLFTLGWFGIPPLLGNLAAQVRKLASDLPGHFQRVQEQRKTVDQWIAEKIEVDHLPAPIPELIYADVDALATGTLEALIETNSDALLLPPPPKREPAEKSEPARPTVVQLFAINLTLAGGKDNATGADAGARTPAVEAPHDGAEAIAEPAAPADTDASMTTPQPPRFDDARADAFKLELREAINAELKKAGPAKWLPAKVEHDLVPALARKHLALPDDDAKLARFARNTGLRVRDALKQEEYATVINNYVAAGLETARRWVQEGLSGLLGVITGLAAGVFDFFMVLMLTAFFLVFFPTIRDYFRDLIAPPFRDDYGIVLKRIDMRLSGAIRGQVFICIVNTLLTFPGLWFIGAHTDATNLASYSVLLSLLAGVLSMIPIFGVILSTVPMVILALAQGSVGGSLLVVAWISVIHAIEAYILNPNILGHSASMNPIIVVFALLAGKHAGGMLGALLAVPVASVIVSLFGYYRRLVSEQHAAAVGTERTADRWGD